MSIAPSEKEALIALSLVPGLGPARIRALVEDCGSAVAACRAKPSDLMRIRGIGPKIVQEILRMDPAAEAARQLERARRCGAHCLHPDGLRYPSMLREIFDPPPVLWSRGRQDLDFENAIAIVGTRRPTLQGRQYAFELARTLARRGWTIVSGLAYGIDACAHRGALDAGGATAAVLGCGVDVVYPAAHRGLYRRIMDQGVLLSEFPMGQKPDAINFPRRNRVMSGVSRGVVVVEAFETGGGLITARFALDQNREVFAVPGWPSQSASRGCNLLIQAGEAKLVLSADDVETEFGRTSVPGPVTPANHSDKVEPLGDDPIVRCLTSEPQHVDVICTGTGLPVAEVQARLLMLEMSGRVTQLPGKRFYLSGPPG